MIDLLYKKIKCYYCATVVRRKDAVILKLMCQGELKEKIWICHTCADMIKHINREDKVTEWRTKYDGKWRDKDDR